MPDAHGFFSGDFSGLSLYPYQMIRVVRQLSDLADMSDLLTFLSSATYLRESNVFTPVCQSFCSQNGGCLALGLGGCSCYTCLSFCPRGVWQPPPR